MHEGKKPESSLYLAVSFSFLSILFSAGVGVEAALWNYHCSGLVGSPVTLWELATSTSIRTLLCPYTAPVQRELVAGACGCWKASVGSSGWKPKWELELTAFYGFIMKLNTRGMSQDSGVLEMSCLTFSLLPFLHLLVFEKLLVLFLEKNNHRKGKYFPLQPVTSSPHLLLLWHSEPQLLLLLMLECVPAPGCPCYSRAMGLMLLWHRFCRVGEEGTERCHSSVLFAHPWLHYS